MRDNFHGAHPLPMLVPMLTILTPYSPTPMPSKLPARQIAAGGGFVAEWEGAMVGFAAVEPRADGESDSTLSSSTHTCDVAESDDG